jgi:membrane-bound metal-dependent hydrolase YbcI (DUF457 family)
MRTAYFMNEVDFSKKKINDREVVIIYRTIINLLEIIHCPRLIIVLMSHCHKLLDLIINRSCPILLPWDSLRWLCKLQLYLWQEWQ